MNEAVSFLVLARGTGADNCTTAWSAEAVEKYTGIAHSKAAASIKRLQFESYVRSLRGGTRPKYELLPHIGSAAPGAETDLIWLPNEIVTGAAGEKPPLKLVRQTQDPMTLRLFIDLYGVHDLPAEGGVPRRFVVWKYERFQVGQHGPLTIWGFRYSQLFARWEGITLIHRRDKLTDEETAAGKNAGIDLFRRLEQLTDLGLIEWMPHLVESADDGEIIHPLHRRESETIEGRLGRAAEQAAAALLTEGQYHWARDRYIEFLVPVPHHIANVAVVGIARLRYRPRTRKTAAWWGDLNTKADEHLAGYTQLARRPREAGTGQ
jgi:hypothetical protein